MTDDDDGVDIGFCVGDDVDVDNDTGVNDDTHVDMYD